MTIQYVQSFAKKMKLNITEFSKKEYIMDEALELGGVKVLSLTSPKTNEPIIDFVFDKNDKIIGHHTDRAHSFVKL